jgi:hypothetical protein
MVSFISIFLYRLVVQVVVFLGIELPLQLFGALILLPLAYFYDIGKLPRAVRYFDSADPFTGRDVSVITHVNTLGYWAKYTWLAWRNPCNYYGYMVSGYQFTGTESYTEAEGLDVGDSTDDVPGFKHIELSTGPYEYSYVKRIGEAACFYFRMGHKIGDLKNMPGEYCQKVFNISYRSYSGKDV